MRVKDIAVLSFAETAQRLLVIYIREALGQPRAAAWFEGTWTGDHRRWTLAHAGYAGSNNNMGQEVDWRDMKKEVAPSVTLGTHMGALVGLIEQLGDEERAYLAKTVANLFPRMQKISKPIYDRMQSCHYNTLRLSFILSTITSKSKSSHAEWDAITESIHMSGESAVPLHLKIRAYHVDIARGDKRPPGLKMSDIISIVVPRQKYLRAIDPDGTRPFEEVKAEVKAAAQRYYHLVQLDDTSAKHRAEVERGLISGLDVYDAFHLITRQPGWGKVDERVMLSDDEEEDEEVGEAEAEAEEEEEEDKKKPPPQIEASCSCRWCCKWTVCEHTALFASVFSPKYRVPGKLIAATPALRKKTNSIRGLAGVRRKRALAELRQQKAKSASKLTYMDRPQPRRPMLPEPEPAAEPAPAAEAFVIPTPNSMPPSDDEVLLDFLWSWLILTVARARLSSS